MMVLDTNVLSALMRKTPDAKVITWLDKQSRTSVWTTSVTILEIRFGLQIMAAGRRRFLLLQAKLSLRKWVIESLLSMMPLPLKPQTCWPPGSARDGQLIFATP
jgi:predicted nucleic acid-binding protein